MRLTSLYINNFRNILEINKKFDSNLNLNLITGNNAQGKTNFLEAICLTAHLKSFRTSIYDNLIQKNKLFFMIKTIFTSDNGDKIEIKIGYSLIKKKKKILINNKELKKYSEIWGKIPLVYFIPDEQIITSGPPVERRSFLDKLISQTDANYLSMLKKYQDLLKQKNSLLQKSKKTKTKPFDLLDIYNKQSSTIAGDIVNKRISFLDNFKKIFKPILLELSNVIANCDLKYNSLIDLNNYSSNLYKKLNENRELEIIRGLTMLGPHKDDLSFEINNNNIRYFGSKGQHKTFLMALKLAQMTYLEQELKETPIFLIDDLHSEIDKLKIIKFAKNLNPKFQTIISDCNSEIDEYFKDINLEKIVIKNGQII